MACNRLLSTLYLTLLACCGALVVPASAQHFKLVTGSLTQVAAGRNEVFGIGTANQIYRYNPGTKAFVQIPGSAAQVAVGGGSLSQKDEVWALGTSNQIYRFNFGTKTFGTVPGSLTQIVVGEGVSDMCHPYEVWGLNSAQLIFRYNYCSKQFDQIPGALSVIATSGGSVWGLNSSAQIYRFDGAEFAQIPGSLQQIVVGVNNVFGLDGSGVLYRFDDISETFVTFAGTFVQMAHGGDGLWLIQSGSGNPVYLGPAEGFRGTTNPPVLVQIAVGSGAGVWGVDSSHRVYTFVRP